MMRVRRSFEENVDQSWMMLGLEGNSLCFTYLRASLLLSDGDKKIADELVAGFSKATTHCRTVYCHSATNIIPILYLVIGFMHGWNLEGWSIAR